MFDQIRSAVEVLGWLFMCWGLVLLSRDVLRLLRRWTVRCMVRHTQGVCDGVAASGMFSWAVPGNMPIAGMSGTFSYCPWPSETSSLTNMDGPAVIISGIAGQDSMTGFAYAAWCEGPPLSCDLGGQARRYARLFWMPLIPIGYRAGFWIGRKFGAHALSLKKPTEEADWVFLKD
jgi:hypothetical protein